MTDKTKTPARPLYEIAREIRKDWKAQTKNGRIPEPAEAYLGPMETLNSVNDNYIMDSGRSIVAYFLGNATSWKGDVARRIKAELNAMIKR
jgi:hypothetical protein